MTKDTIYDMINDYLGDLIAGKHRTDGLILETEDGLQQFTIKVTEKKVKYKEGEFVKKNKEETPSVVDAYKSYLEKQRGNPNDYKLSDDEWNAVKIVLKDHFIRERENKS